MASFPLDPNNFFQVNNLYLEGCLIKDDQANITLDKQIFPYDQDVEESNSSCKECLKQRESGREFAECYVDDSCYCYDCMPEKDRDNYPDHQSDICARCNHPCHSEIGSSCYFAYYQYPSKKYNKSSSPEIHFNLSNLIAAYYKIPVEIRGDNNELWPIMVTCSFYHELGHHLVQKYKIIQKEFNRNVPLPRFPFKDEQKLCEYIAFKFMYYTLLNPKQGDFSLPKQYNGLTKPNYKSLGKPNIYSSLFKELPKPKNPYQFLFTAFKSHWLERPYQIKHSLSFIAKAKGGRGVAASQPNHKYLPEITRSTKKFINYNRNLWNFLFNQIYRPEHANDPLYSKIETEFSNFSITKSNIITDTNYKNETVKDLHNSVRFLFGLDTKVEKYDWTKYKKRRKPRLNKYGFYEKPEPDHVKFEIFNIKYYECIDDEYGITELNKKLKDVLPQSYLTGLDDTIRSKFFTKIGRWEMRMTTDGRFGELDHFKTHSIGYLPKSTKTVHYDKKMDSCQCGHRNRRAQRKEKQRQDWEKEVERRQAAARGHEDKLIAKHGKHYIFNLNPQKIRDSIYEIEKKKKSTSKTQITAWQTEFSTLKEKERRYYQTFNSVNPVNDGPELTKKEQAKYDQLQCNLQNVGEHADKPRRPLRLF